MIDSEMKIKSNKTQLSLVQVEFIELMAKVLMHGNTKHVPNSWKQQKDISLYHDALYRHWFAYLKGEYNAPDSKLPHLAHVAVNAMILHYLETCTDDQQFFKCKIVDGLPFDVLAKLDDENRCELNSNSEWMDDFKEMSDIYLEGLKKGLNEYKNNEPNKIRDSFRSMAEILELMDK